MSRIDCDQVLRSIELYLDGELSGPECEDIEDHLRGCDACLDKTEFRRRLRELIARKCGPQAVPESMFDRVRSLLEGGAPR